MRKSGGPNSGGSAGLVGFRYSRCQGVEPNSFTGSVKMAFSKGKLRLTSTTHEYNAPDVPSMSLSICVAMSKTAETKSDLSIFPDEMAFIIPAIDVMRIVTVAVSNTVSIKVLPTCRTRFECQSTVAIPGDNIIMCNLRLGGNDRLTS